MSSQEQLKQIFQRISFQMTSKIDSRTILGEQGAEQLLGKGDMLQQINY